MEYILTILIILIIYALCGLRVVRPIERGVVETFGKYSRFANPGLNLIWPIFQKIIKLNITEQMADIAAQEIITEDNLNAAVDLVVYFKVKQDEENVKNALYNVDHIHSQLVTLAQTSARNVIGGMSFKGVNSKRNELNRELEELLRKETTNWGVEVVRVELKEIVPPQDVQETMNQVIKAENTKRSAIDFATARETEADGLRRAAIKEAEGGRAADILEAEGERQASILVAEGKAKAFGLINESFKGNAQLLKKLDVTENALKDNAKIIITKEGINPQIILGEIPVSSNENRDS